MKKLIIISDWAGDDLTCQEIKSTIEGYLKDSQGVNMNFVSATPSTIHTAFLLQQVAEIEERFGKPMETVIFVNTDPRIQTKEKVKEAKGAEFIVVKLKSGLFVMGPNAGFCFALIKSKIDEIFAYKDLDRGSQFRSRDLYSRVAAHLMDNLEDELEFEEIHTDSIPVLDRYYVGHIDNYGNIKTTMKLSELKGKYEYRDEVDVMINNVRKKARFVDNLFGAEPGRLVIYPGSSGVKSDPYLEISVWRHFTEEKPTTGLHEFNHPKPGMEVKLSLF